MNAGSTEGTAVQLVPNETPEHQLENVTCPICFHIFDTLGLLNEHLDTDHDLGDSIEISNDYESRPTNSYKSSDHHKRKNSHKNNIHSSKQVAANNVKNITRKHWKKYVSGTKCHNCKRILNKDIGTKNCTKCGNLFCKRDSRNFIRLNLKAEYDPDQGKWYNCCSDCFNMRPGYNDYGKRNDLTDSFVSLRDSKSEDKNLRRLQLENRLVRLIDGVTLLYEKYNGNMILTIKFKYELSLLERTVAPWKDDELATNCSICHDPFSLVLRRHHCRLCGTIVCDNKLTGCSSEISVKFMKELTSDLPYKYSLKNLPDFDESLRLCLTCLDMVYIPRQFHKDRASQFSEILTKYENLHNLSSVINNILPQFEEILSRIEINRELDNVPNGKDIAELAKLREKLVRSFTTYNMVSKQLLANKPQNYAEQKIQESIRIVSANFINEKILPIKNIPSILSPLLSSNSSSSENSTNGDGSPKVKNFSTLMSDLSIKEIKAYREELMVYKEQSFMIESMIHEAKKLRKFDEIHTLSLNLRDITSRIDEIQKRLGEQSFD